MQKKLAIVEWEKELRDKKGQKQKRQFNKCRE